MQQNSRRTISKNYLVFITLISFTLFFGLFITSTRRARIEVGDDTLLVVDNAQPIISDKLDEADPLPPPPPPQPLPQAENWEQILHRETLSEKLARIATERNREVIVTTATYGFRELLYNWMCTMQYLSLLEHVLIYTNDAKLAKELVQVKQFTNVYLDLHKAALDSGYGVSYASRNYQMLMVIRTQFVEQLLVTHNYKVLLADNDAVWFHNALDYITTNYHGKDLIAQDDSNNKNITLVCGGFIYLNNTATMQSIWSELTRNYTSWVGAKKSGHYTEQLMLDSAKSRYSYEFLPRDLYPSGYFYFKPVGGGVVGFPKPHVIHNNWIVGKMKKLDRFRRKPNYLWYLNPRLECLPQSVFKPT